MYHVDHIKMSLLGKFHGKWSTRNKVRWHRKSVKLWLRTKLRQNMLVSIIFVFVQKPVLGLAEQFSTVIPNLFSADFSVAKYDRKRSNAKTVIMSLPASCQSWTFYSYLIIPVFNPGRSFKQIDWKTKMLLKFKNHVSKSYNYISKYT